MAKNNFEIIIGLFKNDVKRQLAVPLLTYRGYCNIIYADICIQRFFCEQRLTIAPRSRRIASAETKDNDAHAFTEECAALPYAAHKRRRRREDIALLH